MSKSGRDLNKSVELKGNALFAKQSSTKDDVAKAQGESVLSRVMLPLDSFPLHGLNYSGRHGSDDETLYKKDLDRVVELNKKGDSRFDFRSSLVFSLCGLSDILENPDFRPSIDVPVSDKRPSISSRNSTLIARIGSFIAGKPSGRELEKNNLEFIKSIASERSSEKIAAVIAEVYRAGSREELDYIANRSHNPNLDRLLKSFKRMNSDKVTNAPFVFYQYALAAELLVIAKQLAVLEKSNNTIKSPRDIIENPKNVDLLDHGKDESREKMLKHLKRKCHFISEEESKKYEAEIRNPLLPRDETAKGIPMQRSYEIKSKAAVESANRQFKVLSDEGKLPIYLKDPATRFFKSKNGREFNNDITISEDQYNALRDIDDIIHKGVGGKSYIRMPTGAGKSHLEKLIYEIFVSKLDDELSVNQGVSPSKTPTAVSKSKKGTPSPNPAGNIMSIIPLISPSKTPHAVSESKKGTLSPNRAVKRTGITPTISSRLVEAKQSAEIPESSSPIDHMIGLNLNSSKEDLDSIISASDLKKTIIVADEAFIKTPPAVSKSKKGTLSPNRAGKRTGITPPIPESISLIDHMIGLNLNSSKEDLDLITSASDLKKTIIVADEAFFYSRLFFDNRFDWRSEQVRGSEIEDTKLVQVEKLKDEFIASMHKKGAVVLVMGASESLDKIDHEVSRIEGKIEAEKSKLAAQNSVGLVKEANSFLYSFVTSTGAGKTSILSRSRTPIFSQVIGPDTVRLNGEDKIAINGNLLEDKDKKSLIITKKEVIVKRENSNKAEFLIRTAWNIKQLCKFLPPELKELKEIQAITEALTPKHASSAANKVWSKEDYWDKSNTCLKDLLLASGIFTTKQIDKCANDVEKKSFKKKLNEFQGYSINLSDLKTAVDSFFKEKLSDGRFLYDSLPKDLKQQKIASDGSRLSNLQEKLRIRKYQREALRRRRDVSTKERFDRSELFTTESYDIEALSAKEHDESGNEIESKKPSALFTVVKDVLLIGSASLRPGQKMQYVLPDFDINDDTCGEKGLREIARFGADIVIIPHKDKATGKLKCIISCNSKGNLFSSEAYDLKDINRGIALAKESLSLGRENPPSIISFFDIKNAIGGDYGKASVNIAKQYVQLTKDDCLTNKDEFLTWNHMMQFNRNRTDPDSIDYDQMNLRFILPKAALDSVVLEGDIDGKTAIRQAIDENTKEHDAVVLRGYKKYKAIGSVVSQVVVRDDDLDVKVGFDESQQIVGLDFYGDDSEEKDSSNQFVTIREKKIQKSGSFESLQTVFDESDNDDVINEDIEDFLGVEVGSDGSVVSQVVVRDDDLDVKVGFDESQQIVGLDFYGDDSEEKDSSNQFVTIREKKIQKSGSFESLQTVFDESDNDDVINEDIEDFLGVEVGSDSEQSVANLDFYGDESEDDSEEKDSSNQFVTIRKNKIQKSDSFEPFNFGSAAGTPEDQRRSQQDVFGTGLSTIGGDTGQGLHNLGTGLTFLEPGLESSGSSVVFGIVNSAMRREIGLNDDDFLSEESSNEDDRSPSSSVASEGSSKLNEMLFDFYDPNNFISYEVTPSEKKFRSNETDDDDFLSEESSNEDDRSPSSSVASEGSSKLNEMLFDFYDPNNFISYEVTPSEKEFRSNETDEVKTIMVFRGLFDESNPDEIYDLIANIIVCAAKEKELSLSETLRMVQIVKETQSVSDATLPRDMSNPFTEEDKRRVEQYEDFLGYFQELCENCGIYSYLTEFQGLRLCNITKESDNLFKQIVEENRESFSEEILEDAHSMVNEQIKKLEDLIELAKESKKEQSREK